VNVVKILTNRTKLKRTLLPSHCLARLGFESLRADGGVLPIIS